MKFLVCYGENLVLLMMTPVRRVNLAMAGSHHDDRQWRHCALCRKRGHNEEWCWTPHKYCPEKHCQVKSTHAYYAQSHLCQTTLCRMGQPLPEDEDLD
jgi:hypothetical protein